MHQLRYIFGSEARVKIMRLFLFNDQIIFDNDTIHEHSKVSLSLVRKEINILQKIGFIRAKTFIKEIPLKNSIKKRRVGGWVLNAEFTLIDPLRILLIESNLVSLKEFHKRFSGAGTITLLVVSGIFVRDDARLVDILMVGNKLKKKVIDTAMKNLEAEIGKEIRYAVFDQADFMYRMDMYDKLLRDIFDHKHKKLINKLNIHL